MNYRFSTKVPKEEYDEFLMHVPMVPYGQRPEWGVAKSFWRPALCGLYRDDKLVAASQLLTRDLPMGFQIIYATRGFLLDYTDKEVLHRVTEGARDYAKSQKAFCIQIDPFILNNDHWGVDPAPIFENLKAEGYLHQGFGVTLYDYFMPRFQMAVRLTDENRQPLDPKALLKSFRKDARATIGNYQKNRGVFFEKAGPEDDLSEFARMVACTEERQNVVLRNAEYFRGIKKAFGDKMDVYYGRLDLDKYIAFTQAAIDKGQNVEKNTANLEEAKKAKEERGQIVTLCGGLFLLPPKGEGYRFAEYLYAGNDLSLFPRLSTSNGMLYAAMCDFIEAGYDYCNLGGVEGSMDTPLYEFKQKFSPEMLELIGEFDLVVRPVQYHLFTKYLPAMRKVMQKVRRTSRKLSRAKQKDHQEG